MLTKSINLENTTRGRKIASEGFGGKKDALGYFNSTSLSLLNEKTVAMFYHLFIRDGFDNVVFYAGDNYIEFNVIRVNNSTCFASVLTLEMVCFNKRHPYSRFLTPVEFQISYKNSGKNADVIGYKYEGDIERYNAYGDEYSLIYYVSEDEGYTLRKKWYYEGYSIKVLNEGDFKTE